MLKYIKIKSDTNLEIIM